MDKMKKELASAERRNFLKLAGASLLGLGGAAPAAALASATGRPASGSVMKIQPTTVPNTMPIRMLRAINQALSMTFMNTT